jgi:DNA-binding response OmpR family regulator
MATIFLVSREPRTRDRVSSYLVGRDHEVLTAASYDEAMEALPCGRPDVLIVDVQGAPRDDGSAASFPQFGRWLASALGGADPSCVYLLHKGARRPAFRVPGVVIKKPFALESLGAAVRQCIATREALAHACPLELESDTNTLRAADRTAHLTNVEAALLGHLMAHQGKVLRPGELLVDVWHYRDAAGASTLVRAHVSNLRRKIRAVSGDAHVIETVRGQGYRYIA